MLKDFLGYAESEVRSLASLYSGVVFLWPMNLYSFPTLHVHIKKLIQEIFGVSRGGMQMHWLFILGKIQLVVHLSKVFLLKVLMTSCGFLSCYDVIVCPHLFQSVLRGGI